MSSSSLKPLIVILGSTASGKSEMALKLAKKFKGEIVNADSRQIYKEMDIGTGSPYLKVQSSKFKVQSCSSKLKVKEIAKPILIDKIPHYLFHISPPNKQLNAAIYKKLAIKTIRDIQKRGKLPILVGGTGLYISAVVDNLIIPKAPPSKLIREKLEKKSALYLFKRLKKIDPKSAEVIGRHNKRKLIRALEVCEITGKPFSNQWKKGKPLFNVLEIGIAVKRDKLYKKIDLRVEKMIKQGLVEETKRLLEKYSPDLPAMSGIGYKEIGLYLNGNINLEEAIQKIKYRTHQYARRQMTWFRRDKRIRWVGSYRKAKRVVNKFLKLT